MLGGRKKKKIFPRQKSAKENRCGADGINEGGRGKISPVGGYRRNPRFGGIMF